ncbi:MAG: helix-turn-helix transcriptional regulator [Lachnospiraceae bacterium]|nr:helix-turn-helix transcriptional regulator [Lachnospiraceae bacterium]
MSEKPTSRVGSLIRAFRTASDMTQKELARRCGVNESTIRNYELGNRYPDDATLMKIADSLNVSYYTLADPSTDNIFGAINALFDIERTYGLRPTIKDGMLTLKFDDRLPNATPHPQEDIDNFKIAVEHWARLRDRVDTGEVSERDYYLKKFRFPANPVDADDEISLDVNDDEKMIMRYEELEAEEMAEMLIDMMPEFSYVKRKRKPRKE